jgi:iron-sulfur cluster assembly accessory protein
MTTETQRPSFSVAIELTETAAEQVRDFLSNEKISVETGGIRVSVMPGGCSGFKYNLNIEEDPLEDDIVLTSSGLRLFVDAFSAQYLEGTTIDYVTSINGQGFSFNNPTATGGCGCGSSFSA